MKDILEKINLVLNELNKKEEIYLNFIKKINKAKDKKTLNDLLKKIKSKKDSISNENLMDLIDKIDVKINKEE